MVVTIAVVVGSEVAVVVVVVGRGLTASNRAAPLSISSKGIYAKAVFSKERTVPFSNV